MGRPALRRRRRAGVTLLEIAIVVGIIGILAAVGAMLMRDTIPGWRTRRAAAEFGSAVELARSLAVAEGFEYRVRVTAADGSLDTDTNSIGTWLVERGDKATDSTIWDILPVDAADGSDDDTNEGTTDISVDGADELREVSIEPPPGMGADGFDIVFSPRGWVANPTTDFDATGYIGVTFVNKRARLAGDTDERTVQVARSGMVRIVNRGTSFPTTTHGVQGVSTGSSGTGYAGGS